MSCVALARDFMVALRETQDIVNIAGTVRAMLNMGLRRLRLVRPALFDAYRIAGIAHGSEPMLEQVEFFDTLPAALADVGYAVRSEEHTSELQSPCNLVCRLLLEKKKRT